MFFRSLQMLGTTGLSLVMDETTDAALIVSAV